MLIPRAPAVRATFRSSKRVVAGHQRWVGLLCSGHRCGLYLHAQNRGGTRAPRSARVQVLQPGAGHPKTAPAGAFKTLKFRKYAQICLADFAYRFNQCADLRGLVANLTVGVARTRPTKEMAISCRRAEPRVESAHLEPLASIYGTPSTFKYFL